jgi:cobalt/nickel transport system permease protein
MDSLSMHIANGILDAPVSVAYAVIAAIGLAVCLTRSRRDLDDKLAPMAGLVAAFIFAVQMLNFPVFPGISGHLLGGTLAVMLVGPWVGALCVAIVLVVQSLVFADGGVTALGANITNMALVGAGVGYLLVFLLLRVLPRTPGGLGATAFVASVLGVVISSQSFVLQYALGGATPLTGGGLGSIAAVMAGTHLLIGVGEGLIAATTVMTVAKTRPDLVYALRSLRPVAPAARPVPVAGGAS